MLDVKCWIFRRGGS